MSFSMAALLSVAQQELTTSQAGDNQSNHHTRHHMTSISQSKSFNDKIHFGLHFDDQGERASSAHIPVIQSIENLSYDDDDEADNQSNHHTGNQSDHHTGNQSTHHRTSINQSDDEESDKECSISNDDEQNERKPYGGRPLKFQCPHCDRRFHAPSHLKRHVMSHSSERPFRCDVCDKGFLQAWHLGRHMTTHTGNKPFRCSECPKSFGSRFEMKTHINYIHKGIKEHQCNVCGKYFTLRSNLKVHMRKHTGEKPYHCSYCSKRFGQRGHLQYHIRKHMGKQEKLTTEATKEAETSEAKRVLHKAKHDYDDDSSESDKDSGVESCDFDLESTTSSRFSPNFCDLDEQPDTMNEIPERPLSPEFGMTSPTRFADIKSKPCPTRCPTGDIKPYVCQSCNCGFTGASSLRAHVRHWHARKGIVVGDYRCAFCLQGYSVVDSLQKHINEQHAEDVSSEKQADFVAYDSRKRHLDSTECRKTKSPSPKALAFSVERLCQKDEPRPTKCPRIQQIPENMQQIPEKMQQIPEKMQQIPQRIQQIPQIPKISAPQLQKQIPTTSIAGSSVEMLSDPTSVHRDATSVHRDLPSAHRGNTPRCMDMLLSSDYLRRLADYEQLLSRREKYLNQIAALILTNPRARPTQYPSQPYPGLLGPFRH